MEAPGGTTYCFEYDEEGRLLADRVLADASASCEAGTAGAQAVTLLERTEVEARTISEVVRTTTEGREHRYLIDQSNPVQLGERVAADGTVTRTASYGSRWAREAPDGTRTYGSSHHDSSAGSGATGLGGAGLDRLTGGALTTHANVRTVLPSGLLLSDTLTNTYDVQRRSWTSDDDEWYATAQTSTTARVGDQNWVRRTTRIAEMYRPAGVCGADQRVLHHQVLADAFSDAETEIGSYYTCVGADGQTECMVNDPVHAANSNVSRVQPLLLDYEAQTLDVPGLGPVVARRQLTGGASYAPSEQATTCAGLAAATPEATWHVGHDAASRLLWRQDALGRVIRFERDAVGRVVAESLLGVMPVNPDDAAVAAATPVSTVAFAYDAAGNRTVVDVDSEYGDGLHEHDYTYWGVMTSHEPPDVGIARDPVTGERTDLMSMEYDGDRLPVAASRGAQAVEYVRDAAGTLTEQLGAGADLASDQDDVRILYEHDAATGRLVTATYCDRATCPPDGQVCAPGAAGCASIERIADGSLTTEVNWHGTVHGWGLQRAYTTGPLQESFSLVEAPDVVRASVRSVFPTSPDFDTMGIEWFDGPVEDGAPDFDWMSFVDRSTSRVTDTLFHVTTETTGGPASLGPSEWLTASAPAPHAHTLAWFGVPDAAGRVVAVHGMYDETREYEYDPTTGRLLRVMRIGDDVHGDEVLESFSWDANGNPTGRTSVLGGASVTIGSADIEVDEQDRLLRYGGRDYYYDASGRVSEIGYGSYSRSLSYDDFGNLRAVATSGVGTHSEIRYDVDAVGRRVARHVVGAPADSRYWLYQDALNPVAQLDAQHRLESVFLYGQRSHSPSVVVTFDVTTGERDRVFRALHDMRGSIIALVDAESGEIVQETEYSAFGEVVAHTGVAEGTYHPFGFAGGLYDPSTGLTRFGARDYDAYVGRWLDRDPILWDGGLWNLYDYVGGDPIDWVDSTGLQGCLGRRGRELSTDEMEAIEKALGDPPPGWGFNESLQTVCSGLSLVQPWVGVVCAPHNFITTVDGVSDEMIGNFESYEDARDAAAGDPAAQEAIDYIEWLLRGCNDPDRDGAWSRTGQYCGTDEPVFDPDAFRQTPPE